MAEAMVLVNSDHTTMPLALVLDPTFISISIEIDDGEVVIGDITALHTMAGEIIGDIITGDIITGTTHGATTIVAAASTTGVADIMAITADGETHGLITTETIIITTMTIPQILMAIMVLEQVEALVEALEVI